MKTVRFPGQVDEQHRLIAQVPEEVAPGPVQVMLLMPTPSEVEEEATWMEGIAHEWAEELSDPREDIYSLSDGEPVRDSR